jgi:hypothetical protein
MPSTRRGEGPRRARRGRGGTGACHAPCAGRRGRIEAAAGAVAGEVVVAAVASPAAAGGCVASGCVASGGRGSPRRRQRCPELNDVGEAAVIRGGWRGAVERWNHVQIHERREEHWIEEGRPGVRIDAAGDSSGEGVA